MGCGYVVFVLLFAGGLGLLLVAANTYDRTGTVTRNVLVPGMLGAGLVAGSLGYLKFARRVARESAAEEARRAQFPGQPWKWKKEWIGPAIESKQGAVTAGLWFFALVWNAMGWGGTIAIFMRGIRKAGEYFILLFPLVGGFILWAAIYQTIRARKFGRVRFVPASLPGVIGGDLGGVIDVPARVVPEGAAKVSLKCLRREVRGSGKNRRTVEVGLWEHEESVPREKWISGVGTTRIPVLFYIPPTCQATDDSDPVNAIVWRLSASAEVPGVDFSTDFDVPVFVTGESGKTPGR